MHKNPTYATCLETVKRQSDQNEMTRRSNENSTLVESSIWQACHQFVR